MEGFREIQGQGMTLSQTAFSCQSIPQTGDGGHPVQGMLAPGLWLARVAAKSMEHAIVIVAISNCAASASEEGSCDAIGTSIGPLREVRLWIHDY